MWLKVASCLCMMSLLPGCGPSLRRTYQSDVAFATCFEADYAPDIDPAQKRECWDVWLSRRVVNQPADKERYARLRLRELDEGVSVPGPPGPPGSFDQRPKPQELEQTQAPVKSAP
jgi:hypothetical protein